MSLSNPLKNFSQNFLRCGLAGWCMEILFTSLNALRCRDFKLKGNTSLWMFPIYGCAAFLAPISRLIKRRPFWVRGLTYMSLIFSAEYFSGAFLKRRGLCPWDYGRSRFHINRLIRLDYAPCWFGAGLFFERFLLKEYH
ncbi:MAG: putative ABC transporter permease [Roseburia sp.]|nr:putative ABC transporter permease [Roseburia sp.]